MCQIAAASDLLLLKYESTKKVLIYACLSISLQLRRTSNAYMLYISGTNGFYQLVKPYVRMPNGFQELTKTCSFDGENAILFQSIRHCIKRLSFEGFESYLAETLILRASIIYLNILYLQWNPSEGGVTEFWKKYHFRKYRMKYTHIRHMTFFFDNIGVFKRAVCCLECFEYLTYEAC